MKPHKRVKQTGRRERGFFAMLPHAVMDSPNWQRCSATAIKLLCQLMRQFNGRNNGDLCATIALLHRRGWRIGSETLALALRELRHYGLIVLTRQGGLNTPNLYALTWHPIHDCGGKLDSAATNVAPGDWKQPRDAFQRPARKRNATTETEAARYGFRTSDVQKAA